MHTRSHTPALRFRALTTLGVAVLATVGVAAVAAGDTVEVAVDGDVHDVTLNGGTVDDVLAELDLDVSHADEIVPDPATPVEDGLRVEISRAITVEVEVEGSLMRRVTAPVDTVGAALEQAELDHLRDEGARLEPGWSAPVRDGDTVTVELPVEVAVTVDDEDLHAETFADAVGDVLDELDVELGPHDRVSPAEHGPLAGVEEITVQRVEVVEEELEVELDHDEVRRETADLERGTTRVEQEGRPGLRLDTYEVVRVDGDEEERERIDREVLREPQDQVVLVGTQAPPTPTSAPSSASAGDGVWDRLAQCESNGNWSANTGNGYHGGLQFHPQTWRSVGGTGLPHQASKAEQIRRAEILQQRSGWGQWPACSRRLGLR